MEVRERKKLSERELETLFHDAGLKMTNQRIAVYREVVENCFHPAVEEVYDRVRAYLPAISLNTVYRTIMTLVEKGLIRRLGDATYKSFYDGNMEPHYHFVCTRCGVIRDVGIDNVDALRIQELSEDVDEVFIQLRGVCRVCRAEEAADRGGFGPENASVSRGTEDFL